MKRCVCETFVLQRVVAQDERVQRGRRVLGQSAGQFLSKITEGQTLHLETTFTLTQKTPRRPV